MEIKILVLNMLHGDRINSVTAYWVEDNYYDI